MFEVTSGSSNIIKMYTVGNYVHKVTAISFFISFLDLITVYLLTVGVQVIVANDNTKTHTHTHTHTHTPSVNLIWTSDQPVAETST
jgi:hypothetical protein